MASQAATIAALKGQTLRIPNLATLFQAWPPQTLNKHYQESVTFTTDTILKIAAIAPGLQLERRLRDDIGLLACLWFPLAPKLRLEALVLYAAWVICWDDTFDSEEGNLGADFAGAERWRDRTLAIAEAALNLPGTSPVGEVDPINGMLVDFGRRYAQEAPLHERQQMYDELAYYISACSIEQRMRLSGTVPGFDDYMLLRDGTVGGGMFCALAPYAIGRDVPREMLSSPHIPVLRKQINLLISFINDPLSLKKELDQDCVLNVVSALMTPETTLDDAIAQMLQKLKDAVQQFDEAAREFISQFVHNDNLHSLARELVDQYRRIATGLLEFTLKSPRYKLAEHLNEDGSLEVVL
ncbi:Terpene synthase [Trichoderma simmonsii]|uniref:Terpene synthase n=1 Tax=Trichoderma simmonsii TaxID=1491479 RepID=A0A8G0LAM9_9HYPO|nr:Terpene synthase [Trichoderma simmonsii]